MSDHCLHEVRQIREDGGKVWCAMCGVELEVSAEDLRRLADAPPMPQMLPWSDWARPVKIATVNDDGRMVATDNIAEGEVVAIDLETPQRAAERILREADDPRP
jgi:hypothetical protein